MEDREKWYPSPKKIRLELAEDVYDPSREIRSSTPVSLIDQQLSTEELGLDDQSFESFIDDVQEEEESVCQSGANAIVDKEEHGLDDQSFSMSEGRKLYSYSLCYLGDFLNELDGQSDSGSDITVNYSSAQCNENVSIFPEEILENILCRLSLIDLYTSACHVCKQWKRIITTELPKWFIKWKVKYHLKKGIANLKVVYANDDALKFPFSRSCSQGLCDLASFVKKEFSHIKSTLKPALQKHPQYSCISYLVQSTGSLSTSLSDLEELVVLVVCCKSIHQLLHLVHLLTSPVNGGFSDPPLSYMEISEILYCLATLFLDYQQKNNLPPRFHYYLFYVLDVMERTGFTPCLAVDQPDAAALQQYSPTASRDNLTSEQMKIINHPFQPGQTVKVLALAGTGKTTTLYHFTRLNPHRRFLYCVYNKSVQQYAENTIFSDCKNVSSRTFHSLAYQNTGAQYKGQLGLGLEATFISWKLNTRGTLKKRMALARSVKETLINYFASSDEDISAKYVDDSFGDFSRDVILDESKCYWSRMKSFRSEDSNVRMTHDGYLKLYQLQKPTDLSRFYDVILVDEAQDLTPAVIDILSRQETVKIFVGDPNQQIYSFLGACNALSTIEATRTYHLTRSFRFGPEIAYVCELALRHFKPLKTTTLVGTVNKGSIDGVSHTGRVVVISRLNSTLFDEVVKVIRSRRRNIKIAFAGTADKSDLDSKYRFDLIEGIVALKNGANPKSLRSVELKYAKSYTDFIQTAEKSRDKALLGKIHVCLKYGNEVVPLLKTIRSMVTFDLTAADVVFSTAHKSKGLEFNTVVVSDDFTADFEVAVHDRVGNEIGSIEVDEDERNLIYVAMTRAKHSLVMSPTILDILPDLFFFPTAKPSGAMMKCCECDTECPFGLEKPTFKLSTDIIKHGSAICRDCYPVQAH